MIKNESRKLLFIVLMMVSSWIFSQRNISGTVLDSKTSEPLIGVSVIAKGTDIGTISGIDGSYSLSIPKETIALIFQYVGYSDQEIALGSENTINVNMLEGAVLDEIIVVGYGTQKKSVNTGAISSLKTKDIQQIPNSRVEQILQGRVAGLTLAQNSGQPGSPSTVRIRGFTTFGGAGNDPLYVVDGVVLDAGAIGALNQQDIESVEVLKDAASAAIYGTRAATGVILITTKKGKEGKISVGYNGFYGTSEPARVLNLLNATQYGALLNERAAAGGEKLPFPDLGSLGVGTDWQKAIFNTSAKRYSHELSLSGGNERSTFYVSFGLQDQEGIVATDISNHNRKNIRLNSTHKISKIFTFGQTLGYSRQKALGIGNTNSEFGGPLSSAINLDPTTPLVVTDANVAGAAPYSVNQVLKDANGNPYGISSIVGQEMTNPVAYIQTRLGNHSWSDDIIGNAFLEAAVTDKIKIRSSIGGKKAFWGDVNYTPAFFLSSTVKAAQNSYGKSLNDVLNWNLENTITYSDKFGDNNFEFLVGQGAYSEGNGGGSGSTLFNLPISNYKDASFSFDIPQANRNSFTFDFVPHKISSLFSRLNYNYKEKYLFTGIIRRDGSSRFGGNNKFGIFPSFSAGWRVDQESFWPKNNTLSAFKLRGGYGVVGNDAIRNFGYLSTVAGGFNYALGNGGAITTGFAPTSLDNPDLRWEETSQANIGADIELFHALNLVVEVFSKTTNGILRPVTIPGYVGVSTAPVDNIADMNNKGIEVELGYRKKIGAVNFSTNANFSYLKNNVTNIAVDSTIKFINGEAAFQSMSNVTRTEVGQSYNSFYGFKTNGIFQNFDELNAYANAEGKPIQPNALPGDFKWVDANNDGKITDLDKVYLGSSIPKYNFGLTTNFEYNNFDLSVFLQGSAGNKIFQGLRRLDIGNSNWQSKALSRWTGEGTSNDYPRLTSKDNNGNFGRMSDFYLEDGDFARIKVVQFGYNLPQNLFNRAGFSKLRVYLTGENLYTLTNYTGYDPEIGGTVFGVDKGVYPQARSFIGGIQIQF